MKNQTENKKRNLVMLAALIVLLVILIVIAVIMVKNRGDAADNGTADAADTETTAVTQTTAVPENGIDIGDLIDGDEEKATNETKPDDGTAPDVTDSNQQLPGLVGNGGGNVTTSAPEHATAAPEHDGLADAAANTEEGYGPLF